MMSLFIYGMEMPKQNDALVVREINGKVYIKHEGHYGFEGRIVEVKEPHGDLIEKEEVINAARRADDDRVSLSDSHIMSDAFEKEIQKITTIIKAEWRDE